MLAIGINYLNGWVMATHPADRTRPEWPPHPDRVFMALVAAHCETDGGVEERRALEWLERQEPPRVLAGECRERSTVTTFVPVNDRADPVKKNRALMPAGSLAIGRDRQPRQFPAAVLEDPTTVHLVWDADPPEPLRPTIGALCGKVTNVGHSASLVQMWLDEGDPIGSSGGRSCLVPVEDGFGECRLRVPGAGRLQHLLARHEAGLRPTTSLWRGYRSAEPAEIPDAFRSGCFSPDLIVLRQAEPRRPLGLPSTLRVTRALRNIVMRACPVQPPPEWLAGHRADGAPGDRDGGHLACIPLPHVGREHADGHLLGLAIAVPSDVDRADVARCLGPILFDPNGTPITVKLLLGDLGTWDLAFDDRQDVRQALRQRTWTGPARRWGTVTPVALDRHPKGPDHWRAIESSIAAACERIGLPRADVVASQTSLFAGAPTTREMPRIERKENGGGLHHVHAVLTFPAEVRGPVLIGAGRFRGYGLCRPVDRKEEP